MTAYVNDEQKKEGAYGKAVKATLAATLAVGMVPAVAVAGEADDVAEGNDVETLALTAQQAWEQGTFALKDNAGAAIELQNDVDGNVKAVEFTADGRAHYLVPQTVTTKITENVEDLTDTERYTVQYFSVDTSAEIKDLSTIKDAGKYKVVVTSKNEDYASATKTFFFNIVAGENKVDKAEFYQVGEEGDFSDKTFEYTGKAITAGTSKGNLALVYNGKQLASGTDYTSIEFYNAQGTKQDDGLFNAGTYTAVITLKDSTTVKKTVTIAKLDLSKAVYTFEASNVDFTQRTVTEINGKADFNTDNAKSFTLAQLFDIKLTSMPDVTDNDALGEYVWSVTPKAGADATALANFEGVGKAVNVIASNPLQAAWFQYDGAQIGDKKIDRSKGAADYDLTKIKVLRDGTNELDKGYYTTKVYDADGNEVDAAKLKETGVWTVKVVVDAKATGYKYAGEASCKVTVVNGEIASDDVAFALDGKVVSDTKEVTYDGQDFLSKVTASVVLNGKKLVQGEDFELVAVDADNNAVDKIVESGTYTVSVKSDKYDLSKAQGSFTLQVKNATAYFVRVNPASLMLEGAEGTKLVYTGEALAPALQYTTDDTLTADTEWKDLPADAGTLGYTFATKLNKDGSLKDGKTVKEMKELGYYALTISDANSKDSIDFDADVSFTDFTKDADKDGEADAAEAQVYKVVKGKVYADVAKDDWFYQNVYDAQKAGYMAGIGDSDIFAPNESTTRAMAAVVLSRMAVEGGAQKDTYTNPFTDIEYTANAALDPWYTNGVLWANATGIVKGYPGTTEFRPDAVVTRAEFCVMMQRYANATDQGVDLAAGEADELLAGYPDAGAVQPWCKDAIAWAVKNGIFGGGSVLNPDGNITRAEMAKMTTVFQAEPLKEKATATN